MGGGGAASHRFVDDARSAERAAPDRRAQLSFEQSRGVIFFSAAYLAEASLTIVSRIDRSAL